MSLSKCTRWNQHQSGRRNLTVTSQQCQTTMPGCVDVSSWLIIYMYLIFFILHSFANMPLIHINYAFCSFSINYVSDSSYPYVLVITVPFEIGIDSSRFTNYCPHKKKKTFLRLKKRVITVHCWKQWRLFMFGLFILKVSRLTGVDIFSKFYMQITTFIANGFYYFCDQPLRNAFRRMGIPPSFVPDHLDSFLSYTVVNYLKKVKQQVCLNLTLFISLILSLKLSLDRVKNSYM